MDETITPPEGTNPEPEEVEVPAEEPAQAPVPEKTYTQAEWNELHGRATRAEAALKTKPPQAPALGVEEAVLIANGMPDELVAELKKVAQVRGTASLLKAQNDPIFVAVKEKFEKDQKHKAAALPAARGAGTVQAKKDFNTPGLSRDEHRKMVAEL